MKTSSVYVPTSDVIELAVGDLVEAHGRNFRIDLVPERARIRTIESTSETGEPLVTIVRTITVVATRVFYYGTEKQRIDDRPKSRIWRIEHVRNLA